VDAPLIAAGCLGLFAAAVHGGGGQALVVNRLSESELPPTRFGGPGMTAAMIQATWHLTTVGFLTVAVALLLAGSALDGDAARAVARIAAGGATAFAVVVVLTTRSPRALLRHPAAAILTATAALAWWGAL
jgi:hypothetical protein